MLPAVLNSLDFKLRKVYFVVFDLGYGLSIDILGFKLIIEN